MSRNNDKLWKYLRDNCLGTEVLTFDEIYNISGNHVDYEFMEHKRDAEQYGITVMKVDLNKRTVLFSRNR